MVVGAIAHGTNTTIGAIAGGKRSKGSVVIRLMVAVKDIAHSD